MIKTSPQKYCNRTCSGKNAIKNATSKYVEQRMILHQGIKEYIIKWSIDNTELVLASPLNRIQTTIAPLVDEIHQLFDVKDFRVISKAVFGEDRGRKELLMFMKKVCNENIC